MTDVVVEYGPMRRMQRHGKNQSAVFFEYAGKFGKDTPFVLDVLDHIESGDEIEGLVVKRKRGDFAG